MSNSTPPSSPIPTPKTISSKKRSLTLWLGIGLIGFALLAFFYGGLIWFGFRAGDAEKTQKVAAETENTLSRQIELAEQNFDQGNTVLAQRRLDYILSIDPGNLDALALQENAQNLFLTPSPSPMPALTATPEPTFTPTPLPPTPDPAEAIATRDTAWAQVQADLETLAIDDQIEQLEIFRAQYPGIYNRESSQQLYDRYVSHGVQLIRRDGVERGILLLTKAQELGDLPEDVLGEIYWAEEYAAGIGYYEVNWDIYFSYFRPLCEFAPGHRDSCAKLIEGLAAAATDSFNASDWCTAAKLYTELATIDPNARLAEGFLTSRITQTTSSCDEPINVATPTDRSNTIPGVPLQLTPTPAS